MSDNKRMVMLFVWLCMLIMTGGAAFASIVVKNPVSGAVFCTGSSNLITWTNAGVSYPRVYIRLWDPVGPKRVYDFPGTYPNSGSFSWNLTNLPPGVSSGGNYFIRVRETNGTSKDGPYGDSAVFKIQNCSQIPTLNSFVVASPTDGDLWRIDQAQTVSWTKVHGMGPSVEISLRGVPGGQLIRSVTQNAANSGYYSIPAGFFNGLPLKEYRLQIETTDHKKVGRTGVFKLAPPPLNVPEISNIQVLHPVSGSTFETGKPMMIRWDRKALSRYATVDIYLLGGHSNTLYATVKKGAANNGELSDWKIPTSWKIKYGEDGLNSVKIKITTPDQKKTGYSGVFSIRIGVPSQKKRIGFVVNTEITNGWAYYRGGDLRPSDCLHAPTIQAGRQPRSDEAKVGHFLKGAKHGKCDYYDEYYFRSRIFFDMGKYQGKDIVEAELLIKLRDPLRLFPSGTEATNEEISSHSDIYLMNGPWPSSPQPIVDFYPGTFLKRFTLLSQNETARVNLLDQVRDWAGGKANHGLMLRDTLQRAKYSNSACIKYYHITLVGTYLE